MSDTRPKSSVHITSTDPVMKTASAVSQGRVQRGVILLLDMLLAIALLGALVHGYRWDRGYPNPAGA